MKKSVRKEISKKVESIRKIAQKHNFFQNAFSVIKILISLAIGFLPSFLFISFFVQYGSPFSNYAKFLMNFSSSWATWLSAFFISFAINAIGRVIKSEHLKKILKNKILVVGIILLLAIIVALIVIQLSLYINFVLRNDVLIRISSDKDNIFFTNNTQEEVTFKISVLMNPFCSAQCTYKFDDVSNGKNLDFGKLNVSSVFSKTKNYTIDNAHLVQGSQVINRFQISCTAKKTLFCYTSGLESTRAILVTVNYNLTQEDIEFKNYSRDEIIRVGKILYSGRELLIQADEGLTAINKSFEENFSAPLFNLSRVLISLNNSFSGLENSWNLQGFSSLRISLPEVSKQIEQFDNHSYSFNREVIGNISLYNNLIENLTYSGARLREISQSGINDVLCVELNNLVVDFNSAVDKFSDKSSLPNKTILVSGITSRTNQLYDNVQSNSNLVPCILNSEISSISIPRITANFSSRLMPNIILNDPTPLCCFSGECQQCCDDRCSKEDYPVIFLHGQSINKALPTDYSLDSFTLIREKITSENYIDAGAMIISSINEPKGLWGKVHAPVTMTASYFFDTYKTASGEEQTVSSNLDNIDTYAIRLKKLIELVKYKTNKDKVIIVAQSMGGIVTRRYVQIFGGENIDKAIFITVPNHGVEGKVRDYCSVIGPAASCNDLSKDSIFMNELNNKPTDTIPIYNIVGIGCQMGDETGDGIIKNSSQYLPSATNYYLKGTCNELAFVYFHEEIVYPEKYPEAYNLIVDILKNK